MDIKNRKQGMVGSIRVALPAFLCVLMLVFSSCESPYSKENDIFGNDEDANVILQLSAEGSSRAVQNITELCSRISVAVFDQEGNKVKSINQKGSDNGYGTIALSLQEGIYKLVVIAHNGEGNATISSADKVTFANNKVTDTYYYYDDLEVGTEKISKTLTLERIVAKIRYTISDDVLPDNFYRFKFYYLGGSSTFSPHSGFGCVNSRQTEYRDRNDEGVYELYTMPHELNDVITKLTVSALDANDGVIATKEYSNIEVTLNEITEIRQNNFFDGVNINTGTASSSAGITMVAESDWAGTCTTYSY
ncbi:MAG: FimB/Mfa2 family fimbrial subunit [Prevotella sp.]|nr:FimB/Mfa2 family fimbrial subunit [Prevotella sp.]